MTITLHTDPKSANSLIVRRAVEFAREVVTPNAEAWEDQGRYPDLAVRAAIKEFGALLVPPELGGGGESLLTHLRVLEEFGKADIAFALAYAVPVNVALTLAKSANRQLVGRYLAKLMSGELLGAFCLTEATGGSDAASIRVLAKKIGEEFWISGKKTWALNASGADLLLLFATTDPNGKSDSIATLLATPNKAEVTFGGQYRLVSGNLTNVSDVIFNELVVASDAVIFPAGGGFRAAMGALESARLGIAAICNGALAGALECSVQYAAQRYLFKSHLLEKQGIQWTFADHLTELEASRLLTFSSAEMYEEGRGQSVMAAHAKKFANGALSRGLQASMRTMGAAGCNRDYPLARQLGAAELLFNTDGTCEVMNVIIGRTMLRDAAANSNHVRSN